MRRHVARPAKPDDFQRLIIILVVHLHIFSAAARARLALQFPSIQIHPRISPAITAFLLLSRWAMELAPLSHIAGMALGAVTLLLFSWYQNQPGW